MSAAQRPTSSGSIGDEVRGDGLDAFSAPTREWFRQTFASPTEPQRQGWDAISRGEHTLVLAPTGSGKTLAAFLWALDRLVTQPLPRIDAGKGPRSKAEPKRVTRVLYVSPLKALTYDVERNLRAPLAGIARAAERAGLTPPDIAVATRTGDTSTEERRLLVRNPPDILITTPESLFLMLTSNAREILAGVEHVIIDEIHAVAATKRGAHLALTLERLNSLVSEAQQKAKKPQKLPQRIGLSATQRPLEELAKFLGGRQLEADGNWRFRPVSIVDAGVRKSLDLRIVVPIEDMGAIGKVGVGDDLVMNGAAAGTPEQRHSIWPSVYPKLLELILSHTSTLVFVNSRRLAERLAAQLNELYAAQLEAEGKPPGIELVRAHHGSVAREQRLEIEELLKAGKLPALVATSSLELGIDMGAIDLVIQVEAPSTVASGLQRIGRAGHQVGQPSKGFVFPKFRHDLVVAGVVARRMHEGLVEQTVVPRNPIDVLAQQIVASVSVDEVGLSRQAIEDMALSTYNFSELTPSLLDGVLDMLAGRYPSDEFAELRPRVNWDRINNRVTPRPGAKLLAVTSGGTIPDRGLYGVFTPGGSRVGELDEEMVYESRVGETFVLGASTWRIEDITRDKVIVTPAPGEPGKMPFWHGDQIGRPYELGAAVGAFLRSIDDVSDASLDSEFGMDQLSVQNVRSYIAEEREATAGVIPTDRQIVVERFRDELGDWRLCVLSPFGARVHAPWALVLEAKIRDRLGLDVQAVWGDDGIVVRLPEAEEPPPADVVILDPADIEELLVGEVSRSALFAARFRENAARALLLPRRRPGSRTPLWMQRQRAADLLAVASRYPDFPIVLETYRECLRDVFDVPALTSLMSDIGQRKVRVAQVDLASPSPFASSLAFAYVAGFMYEGDAPLAERRAAALTLDRRLLAELVGADELRELIDGAALAKLELELQQLIARERSLTTDDAHDMLRKLGDLSVDQLTMRHVPPAVVDQLVTLRHAIQVSVAGQQRLIAVEDAGRYRDALGCQPPSGLPGAFLEPVDDALTQLIRRWARTNGPFFTRQPAQHFGVPEPIVLSVLQSLEAQERLVRGAFRPGGTEREWCDVDVLRLLKQRSLAALRKEVEPAQLDALVRFLPEWHGVGSSLRGVERCFEAVTQLQGVAIPASIFEADVLGVRVNGYSSRLLDELLATGELLWVGAGNIGKNDGRIIVVTRELARPILESLGWQINGDQLVTPFDAPDQPEHHRIRQLLADRGAAFFRELGATNERQTLDALWDLVWAGEVTNDSFVALRAFLGQRQPGTKIKGAAPRAASIGSRVSGFGSRRNGARAGAGPAASQGRWSLVARELDVLPPVSPTESASLFASVLLDRYGVVTREAVRAEGVPGGFSKVYAVYKALEEAGKIRRGYFVAELGGAQFSIPGAVDRLRGLRETQVQDNHRVVLLAAADPANPFGAAVPWPAVDSVRMSRVAGAYVVIVDGVLSLFIDRGTKSIAVTRDCDQSWENDAIQAVVGLLDRGVVKQLTIERVPEELREVLVANKFVPTPKGLTRYA
jgi:ATP-dependent Lhr-like helicase